MVIGLPPTITDSRTNMFSMRSQARCRCVRPYAGCERLTSASVAARDQRWCTGIEDEAIRRSSPGDQKEAGSRGADLELLTQVQRRDHAPVALDVRFLQVVEQPPPLPHELEQPAARVVVLLVDFEMLGQILDALTEQSDLNLRRTGVGLMQAILSDDAAFGVRS